MMGLGEDHPAGDDIAKSLFQPGVGLIKDEISRGDILERHLRY
jgi:hypothetical protein